MSPYLTVIFAASSGAAIAVFQPFSVAATNFLTSCRLLLEHLFRREQRVGVKIDAVIRRIDDVDVEALFLRRQHFVDQIAGPDIDGAGEERRDIEFDRNFGKLGLVDLGLG